MTFHHIEITKAGTGLSGGETCMLGLIGELRKNHPNIVYTPENGEAEYRANGLSGVNISYVVIGKHAIEKRFGILISWLCRTWASRRFVTKLNPSEQHVMISHSDFFPSVLFAYWMKRKNPDMKWLAFSHMLAPNPFKGAKWQFVEGKWTIPSVKSLYFWLSQHFFFLLQRRANALVTVNSGYVSYFKKYNRNVVIICNCADPEVTAFANSHEPVAKPLYDLCYLGRFHEWKGILEFVDVVHRIVKSGISTLNCIVIGDYHNKTGDKVREKINALGLSTCITLVGLKRGSEKCELLRQSKVFVFPSYYESFGIVYLEAITLGVPVVEYDLPIYQVHSKGVVKVPYLDNKSMAHAITELLDDASKRASLSQEGAVYARTFTWKTAADLLIKLCAPQSR